LRNTEVSDGNLTEPSVITSWIKLPQTEAYYDVNSRVMVADAINPAAIAGFDFPQGDSDADGWAEGLTLIHSGYGERSPMARRSPIQSSVVGLPVRRGVSLSPRPQPRRTRAPRRTA
jgi:hypothetical protein